MQPANQLTSQPANRRATLAAVILARNAATTIARCLASLNWVDEIVVVDDGSTDETAEVCAGHGARVIPRRLDTYDQQRNFGLEQATTDWILSLDADEEVSPELRDEIKARLDSEAGVVAFEVPFRQRIFGRWIEHGGWVHFRALRLYRRDGGRWTGAVHERFQPNGPVGTLNHPIWHHSHETIAGFLEKLNRYTDMEAEAKWAAGERTSWWKMVGSPLRDFFIRFVGQRGYRDGMHGLVLAALMAIYVFIVRAKLWERTWQAERGADEG